MQQGLTKIGDLMPMTGNMQQTKDLMSNLPSVSSKSSQTTGSAVAVLELPKLIGAVHGGIGACEQLKIKAAYSEPLEEPTSARVARSIRISMTQPEASLSDGQTREGISDALQVLGGGNRSAREARIAHRITTLLAHYPQAFKSGPILEGVVEDWLEELGQYPFFAVQMAAKHWLKKPDNAFPPQVSRIAALTEMYARHWLEAKQLIERSE